MKIKTQAWEPDTCTAGEPSCRVLILWDADVPAAAREHRVAGFERVCTAHADTVPVGVMQWWDGNWKPTADYIEYQRSWYRRLNHVEWLRDHPDETMPETIRGYTEDPVTTGSVAVPPQSARDGLARAYGRNNTHNQRKELARTMPQSVRAGIDTSRITWTYSGAGDARVLTVNCGGQLTTQQRTQAQALADAAFGPGLVVVVA